MFGWPVRELLILVILFLLRVTTSLSHRMAAVTLCTRLWLVAVNCKARSTVWCSICRSRKNKFNIGYESESGYVHGSDFKSWSSSQFWSGYETQSGFRYVSESGSIYLFSIPIKLELVFTLFKGSSHEILVPFSWVIDLKVVIRPGRVYFSF
jgi:hypothetical protein